MSREYWIEGTVQAPKVVRRSEEDAGAASWTLSAASAHFVGAPTRGIAGERADGNRFIVRGAPLREKGVPPARSGAEGGDGGPSSWPVPVVSSRLGFRDILGGWLVRWGWRRNSYRVQPGLYALGGCGDASPVLVTANYKLSFDSLRKELAGLPAWVLVLDTRGVNVWCAAGKGTFGTEELAERIAETHLAQIVSHRMLILPQLGAPGVAAHRVLAETGFKVVYGPVRAADIPAFLERGMKKDDGMRRVRFGLADRMAVAPIELIHSLPLAAAALVFALILGLVSSGGTPDWSRTATYAAALVPPFFAGTLLFPALLPWLPFRAFAAKGAVLGVIWSMAAGLLLGFGTPETAASTLFAAPTVAYLAMNFTGASTYTGQRGATIEVRRALVPMIASVVLGSAGLLAIALLSRAQA